MQLLLTAIVVGNEDHVDVVPELRVLCALSFLSLVEDNREKLRPWVFEIILPQKRCCRECVKKKYARCHLRDARKESDDREERSHQVLVEWNACSEICQGLTSAVISLGDSSRE